MVELKMIVQFAGTGAERPTQHSAPLRSHTQCSRSTKQGIFGVGTTGGHILCAWSFLTMLVGTVALNRPWPSYVAAIALALNLPADMLLLAFLTDEAELPQRQMDHTLACAVWAIALAMCLSQAGRAGSPWEMSRITPPCELHDFWCLLGDADAIALFMWTIASVATGLQLLLVSASRMKHTTASRVCFAWMGVLFGLHDLAAWCIGSPFEPPGLVRGLSRQAAFGVCLLSSSYFLVLAASFTPANRAALRAWMIGGFQLDRTKAAAEALWDASRAAVMRLKAYQIALGALVALGLMHCAGRQRLHDVPILALSAVL